MRLIGATARFVTAALYNLFQVGTRFRMFWLFLAFMCAVVIHNEGVEARRRGGTSAARSGSGG